MGENIYIYLVRGINKNIYIYTEGVFLVIEMEMFSEGGFISVKVLWKRF